MRQEPPSIFGARVGQISGNYRRLTAFLSRYRNMNWAMSDQGMVSGVNFLTGILLARYLGLSEFGRYTLAWMTIEFLITFQQCLIVAPLMSIGPQTAVGERRAYMGAVVAQQALFAVCSIVIFFGAIQFMVWLRPDWNLEGLSLPLICAALAVQLQNFARRYLFSRNRGGSAFLIDFLRYPGQLAILVPLLLMMKLDAADALWIFAFTSALSALLGGILFEPIEWDSEVFRQTFRRHWNFAKWLLMSEIMRWGTTNLYMAVAGAVLGTVAVGAIRTAHLVLGVCNILMFGMENFALVRASQHYREGGGAALVAYLKRITIFGVFAVGGIAFTAAIVPEFWLGLIKAEYREYGDLVRWWALVSCFSVIGMPLVYGLRTIERTRTIFWAYLVGGVISVITVYPVIDYFGTTGVMAGVVSIQAIRVLLLYRGFQRRLLSRLRIRAQ